MVALVSSAGRLQRSRAGKLASSSRAMRAGKAPVSSIFVSHHSRDDAAACTLRDWLQKEGHAAVFLDHDTEAGIASGEPWEERLYTELRRCRALIALVGPDWLASPWCVAEADHAQALRKLVLPLRIQPIDPVQYADKAPPVLRRVQSIHWDQSEEAHERGMVSGSPVWLRTPATLNVQSSGVRPHSIWNQISIGLPFGRP